MMLREIVSLTLFNKHISLLNTKEVKVCNDFIDNYNTVKELVEQDEVIRC